MRLFFASELRLSSVPALFTTPCIVGSKERAALVASQSERSTHTVTRSGHST